MAWAQECPEQAKALVLMGAPVNEWPGGLGPWYAVTSSRIGGATLVPLIARLATDGMAKRSVAEIFAPNPVPDGYLDYIGTDLTLRSDVLKVNARQVSNLKPHIIEMSAKYDTLELPIELIHGDADTIVPMEIHSVPLSQRLPNAHLKVLKGVGHMPHHTDPGAAVAAVDRAMERAGLRASEVSR